MSTALTILGWWFALSIPAGIAFCWLIKTKRLGFEPIEDRNQFQHDWPEHRP